MAEDSGRSDDDAVASTQAAAHGDVTLRARADSARDTPERSASGGDADTVRSGGATTGDALAPTGVARGPHTAALADKVRGRLFEGAPATPEAIARFEVEKVLGEGGMGVVYLGRDARLDRPVALKLLHDADTEGVVDLEAEAQAMAKLSHPNVAHVYEVGEHEGRVFVAMEYVDGPTLRRWLSEAEPSRDEILERFIQAGRGLAAAHAQGIVHRDFKPDNVLIGSDGRVRVVDFGLARAAMIPTVHPDDLAPDDLAPDDLAPDDQQRTRVAGTPGYMAPEQLRGRKASAATDQFAFCVSLHEALVGKRPFRSSSVASLVEEVEARELTVPAGVPPHIRQALARGLAPEPSARFPSMAELLAALKPASPPRRWPWLVGAVGVVGVGLALASFGPWRARTDEEAQPPPPAVEVDPVQAERDAIVAASDLPRLVPQPLQGDPWAVTVHRLSNGLTVYISPERSQPRVLAGFAVRVGRLEAGGMIPATGLSYWRLQNGTARLGALAPVPAPKRAAFEDVLRRLTQATTDEERDALVTELDAIESDLADTRDWGEPERLGHDLGINRLTSVYTQAGVLEVSQLPTNRLATWAELAAERLQGPWARPRMLDLTRMARTEQENTENRDYTGLLAIWGRFFPGTDGASNPAAMTQALREVDWEGADRFAETWVVPNNTAIVVAGDVERDAVLAELEQAFGGWEPAPLPSRPLPEIAPDAAEGRIEMTGPGRPGVILGWAVGRDDPRALGLRLLGQALSLGFDAARRWYPDDLAAINGGYTQFPYGAVFTLAARAVDESDEGLQRAEAAVRGAVKRLADGEVPPGTMRFAQGRVRAEEVRVGTARAAHILSSFADRRGWKSVVAEAVQGRMMTEADIAEVAREVLVATEPVVQWGRRGPVVDHHYWIPRPQPIAPAQGRSALAQRLIDTPVAPQEPRFWLEGRHYQTRGDRDHAVVAADNEINDFAQLVLRFEADPDRPGDCLALRGLPRLETDEGDFSRVAREHGVLVWTDCDPPTLMLSGADGDVTHAWRALQTALAEPRWGDRWETVRPDLVSWARARADGDLADAVDDWVCTGRPSGFVAPEALHEASADQGAAIVRALLSRPRSVAHFGPTAATQLDSLDLGDVLGPATALAPRACAPTPGIHLVDQPGAARAHVYVYAVIPAPVRAAEAVEWLYTTHLGDVQIGLLPDGLSRRRMVSVTADPSQAEVTARVDLQSPRQAQPELFAAIHPTPDQVDESLAILHESLEAPITKERFDVLWHTVDANIRMRVDEPSALPIIVAERRRYGLDEDPGAVVYRQLPGVRHEDLVQFADGVAKSPLSIVILGDASQIDREGLAKYAPVRSWDADQIRRPVDPRTD